MAAPPVPQHLTKFGERFFLFSEEVSCLLWNHMVHYHDHKTQWRTLNKPETTA